jgi:hypothetical protein
MAWIAVVPPSPRHPYERYQARYQDGKRQRSAGIFPTKRRAEAEQRPSSVAVPSRCCLLRSTSSGRVNSRTNGCWT